VPYLNCGHCGLSIRSRNPLTDREFCPRCRARGHEEPLIRAPLPLRQLRIPPHLQAPPNLRNADTPATR
jgi:hypothetical protein